MFWKEYKQYKRDYRYDSLFTFTYLKVLILFAHLRVLLYKNHIWDYDISDCYDRKSSSVEDYIEKASYLKDAC